MKYYLLCPLLIVQIKIYVLGIRWLRLMLCHRGTGRSAAAINLILASCDCCISHQINITRAWICDIQFGQLMRFEFVPSTV